MATEQTEFTFPDELEENPRKGGAVVEPEAEDTQIEVVDDTPEEDRNRKPMQQPPEEVTEEELTKYDKSVQSRIKQFTKGYHEERRAKEAAMREREEALKLAQTIVEENRKLKGTMSQGQTALLEQAKKTIDHEVAQARAKYKAAYESGDADALVDAQEELTIAKMKAERVQNFKPTPLQESATEVQIKDRVNQIPKSDPQLTEWQERNTWFGPNKRLTAYALGVHEDLISEGIPAGSKEYYRRIDAEMQERFSDVFGSEKTGDADTSPAKKTNVVAPATRSTAPRKVVLTKSQVEIAKRLGVPLELYARKVAEEMRK
jgi:hypothetical protein